MISHVIVDKKINAENIIKDLNEKIEEKYSIHHTSFQVVTEKCC
jgi:Co/Zn/Cd efflux system component